MKNIAQILTSLREGIAKRQAQNESEQIEQVDSAWEDSKDRVDALPQQYQLLIKKNGIKGFESQSGKLTRIQFSLGNIDGMPLELIEYTTADGGVKEAWYALTNNTKGIVYKRNV